MHPAPHRHPWASASVSRESRSSVFDAAGQVAEPGEQSLAATVRRTQPADTRRRLRGRRHRTPRWCRGGPTEQPVTAEDFRQDRGRVLGAERPFDVLGTDLRDVDAEVVPDESPPARAQLLGQSLYLILELGRQQRREANTSQAKPELENALEPAELAAPPGTGAPPPLTTPALIFTTPAVIPSTPLMSPLPSSLMMLADHRQLRRHEPADEKRLRPVGHLGEPGDELAREPCRGD